MWGRGGNQELSFEHNIFEIPFRYLSRYIEKALGYSRALSGTGEGPRLEL